MEAIRINRAKLSQASWEAIYDNAAPYVYNEMNKLMSRALSLDTLREQADYNTGSISTAAIWSIFSACLYFQPQMVAEVGTFIGKSTLALAAAMDQVGDETLGVFTCDFSNDIELNLDTRTQVTQFRKQSSTEMFDKLARQGLRCDLLLLDGRLQDKDIGILSAILHDQSVILLDDFEGTEKGCVNAMVLMSSLVETHFLLYPPTRESMQKRGLLDGCTLAMIVPKMLVTFTNQ